MTSVQTTSSRLLALLSLLQTRRAWSGEDLAERLDITPRTVRRDIDRLRDLGYPITTFRGPPADTVSAQAHTCLLCCSTTAKPWLSRSPCNPSPPGTPSPMTPHAPSAPSGRSCHHDYGTAQTW